MWGGEGVVDLHDCLLDLVKAVLVMYCTHRGASTHVGAHDAMLTSIATIATITPSCSLHKEPNKRQMKRKANPHSHVPTHTPAHTHTRCRAGAHLTALTVK